MKSIFIVSFFSLLVTLTACGSFKDLEGRLPKTDREEKSKTDKKKAEKHAAWLAADKAYFRENLRYVPRAVKVSVSDGDTQVSESIDIGQVISKDLAEWKTRPSTQPPESEAGQRLDWACQFNVRLGSYPFELPILNSQESEDLDLLKSGFVNPQGFGSFDIADRRWKGGKRLYKFLLVLKPTDGTPTFRIEVSHAIVPTDVPNVYLVLQVCNVEDLG